MADNIQKAYKNNTRNITGIPGNSYWQNKADYKLKINFDPESRVLDGYVNIDYQNNSPDTLKQLVIKLYPNLYQQQAMRNMPVSAKDITTGVNIKSVDINNYPVDGNRQLVRGTNMYIKDVSLLPGSKMQLNIKYSYTLNKTSFIRTGQVDSGAFVIAYFFPRVAVYDDIDGWNEYPYLGKEEFYNDFCNFEADITVPGDYQCWATGDLKNAPEVYNPNFVSKIQRAISNDSVTNIITLKDVEERRITRNKSTNTWKFEANNVTDIAFAISNHYVWQASSLVVDSITGRRTRVDAVYNPAHKAYLPVIDYARKAVELISYKIPAVPFPYPHITIFEGLDAMEYPMMVNNLPFQSKDESIEFTVHEIFHSLFPFFVGTNETKNSFMDEGWATLSEFYLSPFIDPNIKDNYNVSDANLSAVSDQDVPIMTLTPQLYGKARYADKDLKPALGLYYLKEMLGEKMFLKASQNYINQWKGKHPTPYDFFYSVNKSAGKNLNWFWRNWYFEKNIPDLAIAKVGYKNQKYKITIVNLGGETIPIHLKIYFKDGTCKQIGYDISCWAKGNKSVDVFLPTSKVVNKITLGAPYDLDVNLKNNLWVSK